MKCFNLEENLDLLLDGEITFLQKQEFESHLAACDNCRNEFAARQAAQNLLRHQPPILPADSFDKRMMQTFENLRPVTQKIEKNRFKNLFAFSNPALRFSFAAGILLIGFGLTFLLGRMSVVPTSNVILSQPETANDSQPKSEQQSLLSADNNVNDEKVSITPEVKVITKYVRVPVIKEKIVERVIYVNKETSADNRFQTAKKNIEENDLAKQFNLKDLQPVATASYRIIRKGENNE